MKMDLRTPCKNCPFANTDTRIRFKCRSRAEEIEESAYRFGFPCHLSAELHEGDDGESSGYVPGPKTQHCVGAIGMLLNQGYDTWPGVGNNPVDEDYQQAQTVAFDSTEEFLDANR